MLAFQALELASASAKSLAFVCSISGRKERKFSPAAVRVGTKIREITSARRQRERLTFISLVAQVRAGPTTGSTAHERV